MPIITLMTFSVLSSAALTNFQLSACKLLQKSKIIYDLQLFFTSTLIITVLRQCDLLT